MNWSKNGGGAALLFLAFAVGYEALGDRGVWLEAQPFPLLRRQRLRVPEGGWWLLLRRHGERRAQAVQRRARRVREEEGGKREGARFQIIPHPCKSSLQVAKVQGAMGRGGEGRPPASCFCIGQRAQPRGTAFERQKAYSGLSWNLSVPVSHSQIPFICLAALPAA